MSGGSASERIFRRYRVSGRVQGVGFRWFVRERARAAGASGIVYNEHDGSVVVDVAGTHEQIALIEEALARGPDGAHVTHLARVLDGDVAERELDPLPFPFAIRR